MVDGCSHRCFIGFQTRSQLFLMAVNYERVINKFPHLFFRNSVIKQSEAIFDNYSLSMNYIVKYRI